MSFTRNRIRLALAVTTPFEQAGGLTSILDVFQGESPLIPHSRAIQFEVALFQGGSPGVLTVDTELTTLTLEIKELVGGLIDTAGAAVLSKTIDASTFNAALTQDAWEADQGFFAVFECSEAEMNLSFVSGTTSRGVFTSKKFGLVVSGLGPDGRVDCGAGIVEVLKSGATGLGSGVPPVVSHSLSDQEILGGIAACLKASVNPAGTAPIYAAENDPTKGLRMRVFVPAGGGDPVIDWVPVIVPT